jgi:cytochrome c
MKKWIATATLIVVSAGTGFTQDVERGASVFRRCQACHAIGPSAQNRVGPELNGLAGRVAGAVPDYTYSDANKHSGIVWNEANFKEYIKDPNAKIPDTKKLFGGIKDEQQAADLWAYLKQFDANGNIAN